MSTLFISDESLVFILIWDHLKGVLGTLVMNCVPYVPKSPTAMVPTPLHTIKTRSKSSYPGTTS